MSNIPPWYMRAQASKVAHVGPINSAIPGRTDRLNMGVKSGSYVVPADIVSGLGQGNTMAGTQMLQAMFKLGPYGSPMPGIKPARTPKMAGFRPMRMKAEGGGLSEPFQNEEPVPIIAAGGEFVIPPESVAEIGNGNVDLGHAVLDKWIVEKRKQLINELKKLPGPAKD